MSQTALQVGFICRAAQLLKEWCSFPRISIKQNLTQFEERYKVTFSHLSSLFRVHFYTLDQHLLVEENSIKCSLFPFSSFSNFFSSTNNTHLLRILGWLLPPLNYKAGSQAKKKKITNKSHGPEPLAEQSEEGGCSGKVLMKPMEVWGWVFTAVRSFL